MPENFQPREILRSGSKAKGLGKIKKKKDQKLVTTMATYELQRHLGWRTQKKKEERRLNDGNNDGQLRIANATSSGARKAAWANLDWCVSDLD